MSIRPQVRIGLVVLIALASHAVEAQDVTPHVLATADRDRWVPATASTVAPMQRPIAVDFRQTPLAEALRTIAQQAGLEIGFGGEVERLKTSVSLHVDAMSVGSILGHVLMGTGLTAYASIDGTQILVRRPFAAEENQAKQDARIAGRVVDFASHQPLVGAAVTVTGTTIGVSTTDSGTFSVPLPADAKSLSVRRIGYLPQTVPLVAGQTDYTVALHQDVLHLEAQVVTGVATTVSSQNAANAISVVDGQQLNDVPTPTLENALQGQIPGALVSQNNGGAPGGGLQVQIRGITTLYANGSPLYVVDGVIVDNETVFSGTGAITYAVHSVAASNQDNGPNRIADLNPEDIESIEVLKGASASAIYGSKASAGVIIITTKRGKAGKAAWSVSQKVGHFSDARMFNLRTFPTLASAQAWYDNDVMGIYDAKTHTDTGAALGADNAYIASIYAGPQNFQSQLFGNKQLSYETDLSVSGTQGGTEYFLSGLTKYDNGTLINTGYNKQSIRSNITQQFSSRVSATANLFYANDVARRGITGDDADGISPTDVLSYTPQFVNLDHRNANGVWATNPFGPANAFADAAEISTPEATQRFIGGGTIDLMPFSTLHQTLRVQLIGGADIAHVLDALYAPSDLQIEQDQSLPGVATTQTSDIQYLNYSINIIHHYTGLSWLDATTSAGFAGEKRSLVNTETVSQNVLSGLDNPASGTVQTNFYNRTGQRDQSWYAQEQLLLLDQRLSLTGGVTAEQSTNDGSVGQFYAYPRYSASYRIPRLAGFVDELKVRAAYGESGTQPVYGVRYSPLGTNVAGGQPGLTGDSILGAANVRPETEQEIELGLDATLLHARAQFSATVYQKRITNLLLQAGVNPSRGYGEEWINGGEFTNQGIELSLQATPVQIKNGLTWFTSTSFARNYSVVNSLPVAPFYDYDGSWIQVGRSVSDIVNSSVIDKNGAPQQVGDGEPAYTMNFNNSLTYGPFRIAGLVEWSRGASVQNYDDYQFYFSTLYGDSVHAAKGLQGLLAGQLPLVQPGDYVKLRSASVSYQLPAVWTKVLSGGRITSARLSLEGRNLLYWFSPKFTGLDPETNFYGAANTTRGIELFPYPSSRSYFLALDLGL